MIALGVTRFDSPIWEAPLKGGVNTEIRFERIGETVPFYEEFQAARHNNISLADWLNDGIDADTKEWAVAVYRIDNMVSNHQQSAIAESSGNR